jgi:hypothetical protein
MVYMPWKTFELLIKAYWIETNYAKENNNK